MRLGPPPSHEDALEACRLADGQLNRHGVRAKLVHHHLHVLRKRFQATSLRNIDFKPRISRFWWICCPHTTVFGLFCPKRRLEPPVFERHASVSSRPSLEIASETRKVQHKSSRLIKNRGFL